MKIRLIAAIVIAACALAGMLLLLREPAAQHQIAETTPETTEEAAMPETTEATVPETTEATLPPDPIKERIAAMTLEEKVGQIFLARCPESGAVEDVQNLHLGGYILFCQDFAGRNPDSLRTTLNAYQAAAEIPLLIAVDEEGGTVCRVSDHPAFRLNRYPSPRTLYRQGGMEAVLQTESEKAWLLGSLGINVNMAPVCDITTKSGAFMYSRSLGESPEETGVFVAGAIRAMADHGVAAVMKHFPGYGNNADTHTGIAVDRRSLSELETADLQPFFSGIEAGGGAILVSHSIVDCIDPDYPASLSETMHRYLRLAMSFDGVIITDDLYMDAIAARYGVGEAAVLAVLADNDLLCSTQYRPQIEAVLNACQQGRIPQSTLDNAVYHVLQWKQQMGLL